MKSFDLEIKRLILYINNFKMATYKKRGAKKTLESINRPEEIKESKTAEVFDTLDVTANKTEEWVVKYQNIILIFIGTIAICVLSYLVIRISFTNQKHKKL